MVGHVITVLVEDKSIDSGSICVLKGESILDVVTVMNLDPAGKYVVVGKEFAGPMLPDMELCTLQIKDEGGMQYPLKFNQWAKSIKAKEVDNPDKTVKFTVLSGKFVEGHYMNRCSDCASDFMGHKRQPFCKECCDKMLTAKILISKQDINAASDTKRKRPRLLPPDKVKSIARQAWKKGLEGTLSPQFEDWLLKQFK